MSWALRKLGVDEWLIRVVLAMYAGSKSAVNINGFVGEAFDVNVGVHQGSALSPLLFIIVMEALSSDIPGGLPWQILYADDLVLMADNLEDLEVQFGAWKQCLESKGLRINIVKSNVMICDRSQGPFLKSGKYPCGVCFKSVGSNSIFCPKCECWIHARCSGINGKLQNAVNFSCTRCLKNVQPPSLPTSSVALNGCNLSVVNKFCYLGDMLDDGGGAVSSSITRARCGWKKFRDLLPLLGSKAVSLRVKRLLYRSCIQPALLYGCETWPSKAEDIQRLIRTESSMVRWMYGRAFNHDTSMTTTLRKLNITPVSDLMRRNRLRWYGHVERRPNTSWLKQVQMLQIPGVVRKGRPAKTWKETIRHDLKTTGLKKEMTQDRPAWRRAIQNC